MPDDRYENAETAERPHPTTNVKVAPDNTGEFDDVKSNAANYRGGVGGRRRKDDDNEQTNLYIESKSKSVNSSLR